MTGLYIVLGVGVIAIVVTASIVIWIVMRAADNAERWYKITRRDE